jgi:lysophospholipase L1-like esterase
MEVEVCSGASRHYFSHDIYVDGTLVSSFGSTATNKGIFAHACALGEGTKTVAVYFPWSVCSVLRRMELADGSTLAPVTKQRKMLVYGDSITQGYDAALTSLSYANRLTDLLDAEAINRGIGGEQFFPALAETSGELEPDLITVAYGTNDWSKKNMADFTADAAAFMARMSVTYGHLPVFVILPIWRGDTDRTDTAGDFMACRDLLARLAASQGFHVLDDYDLVPHDPRLFGDAYLHPTNAGFQLYAQRLIEVIDEKLAQ